MHIGKLLMLVIGMTVMLIASGCDSNENARLAEMAQRHEQVQAEQNRQVAETQREVAAGARQLVEADAKSREATLNMQRELQVARGEIDRQRDLLEDERRDLDAQRQAMPVIAAAVTNLGLLLACLLPLVLCWYLLHRRVDPADDDVVAELLLQEVVTNRPLIESDESRGAQGIAVVPERTP